MFSLKKPPNGELTNLVLVCAKKVKKGYSSCKEKIHLRKADGVSNPIEWWVAIYSVLYKRKITAPTKATSTAGAGGRIQRMLIL